MLVAGIVIATLGVSSAQALAAGIPSVAPSELLFSDAGGGAASDAQTVTLTNTGDAAFDVNGTPAADDPTHFKVTDVNCHNATLDGVTPTCSVTVAFDATDDTTPVTGSLVFKTDSGDVSVSLLGNDPRAQVDPTPRAFVAAVGTTSAAQQVVLTNTGSADLTLTLMPV
ncbi:MAG TPA: hypothetical protein VHZ75_07730, partial [Solirubrobacteraceae bacterium]|nr:hypothetical protein [Solirubrobacteraceae bacterium]